MLISAVAYLKQQNKEWRNLQIYGQEIVTLTSAIARMNLLLHGVQDFKIVNADTLKTPAFTDHNKLQQFDLVLANPPYSIKNWDRTAFESDKYGRNFLGTPPQGRADYAFFQHILKSMNPVTGRCAILFPHGVLFRTEEQEMRENLVRTDLIECVLGIGRNLFYNSPMEACIIICRTNKPAERKNKILFINAKHEVTRKNAQSYLEESHIKKISDAYSNYEEVDGFSKIVPVNDVLANDGELTISLYLPEENTDEIMTVGEAVDSWSEISERTANEYRKLTKMIKVGE